MNCTNFFNAVNPAEHIVYDQPKEGEYKIYVRYFKKKNYDGI
jgi:hypothetical protein